MLSPVIRRPAGPALLGLLLAGRLAAQEPSPLDAALAEAEASSQSTSAETPSSDIWSRTSGTTTFRLVDLSVDLLVAAGGSSEDDESLDSLQGGGHDPRKRGFTLQNVELSLLGAVDPYFTLETHLVYFVEPLDGESEFELEEAFVTSSELPFDLDAHGLELEAGFFFTEFGRHNPRHPHAWDWLDQPVIHTRLFGGDGMRGAGARLGWLTPLPWFSELHVGLQNANGETMASFLASDEYFDERPVGGRPFVDRGVHGLDDLVYLARWANSWDVGEEVTTVLGASALFGPNATGSSGRTEIYGVDCLLVWRPLENERGWPFVSWQSEAALREYRADDFDDGVDSFSSARLEDWGAYSQLLWGFTRGWAAGLRYEYAGGSGESVGDFADRSEDPFRNDRHRVSPLLAWRATDFSRVRLQYNWDHADHLTADQAHSVWLGIEVLIGKHPAHVY